MMEKYSLLIDTHIFLWWLTQDKKLKKSAEDVLRNAHNRIYVSITSLWEISIKHANGKLPLKTTITEMVVLSGFEVLPLYLSHIIALESLPLVHTDPFDRILIAQAKAEGLQLMTDDVKIKQYPDVKVI